MILGGLDLRVPAGTLSGNGRGLFKGTVPLAAPAKRSVHGDPADPIVPPQAGPSGSIKVIVDTNKRTIRLTGKKLDLSGVSSPAILALTLGFNETRLQLGLADKGKSQVY